MQNKHYCGMLVLTRTSCFRVGGTRMKRMTHLQVGAPHGLEGNALLRVPKGTGPTTRDPSDQAEFCEEDDVDVETIFRSAFGGNRFFYWSFINEENSQWRSSSNYNNFGRSWNWRYRNEETYDSSSESESSETDMASDRLALGLSASGPLQLEDVKNAYRVCALKWHPDRHQGSSKAVAEEKFKLCSAAYQSLCDKLAVS
ncbi:hypothetical protein I3760_10G026000 [Carya illinoinensis]|nr:hypothetical protein I3760_10G026000 [Carya illinoinensis]